jgi:transketolase
LVGTATASTREVYGHALVDLGRENRDVVVLGGDLNVSTFTTLFAKEFPDRFFDFGPAEQHILSTAAGLASSGKVPFCSTFAVFGTGRAFDQIRVGIAQPRLNVKLVCTHAGLLTGEDGVSAQSIEDMALMCSLPTMTVIAPSDGPETAQAVRAAAVAPGPVYIRLYRPATPVIHSDDYIFRIGVAETERQGDDVTVVACGSMVPTALDAAELLASAGVSCRVINLHTLRPTDEETIERAARETGALVTAEEHFIHGGLGSIVAGVVARTYPVPVEFVGVTRYAESGKSAELLEKYGLTAAHVAEAARRALARKRG